MRLRASIVALSLAIVAAATRANAVCNVSACSAAPVLAACCTASTCTVDGTLTVSGPNCTFDFDGKSLTVSGTISAQGKTVNLMAKSMKLTGFIDLRGPSAAAPGGNVTITTTGMTGLAFSQEGGAAATIDASSSGAAGGKIFIHADGPVSLSKGTVRADGGPASPGGVVEITTTAGDVSVLNIVSAVQAVAPPVGQRGGEVTILGPGDLTVGGTGRLVADDGFIDISIAGDALFADGSILQSNVGGSIFVTASSVQGFGELRANGELGRVDVEALDGQLLLQRSTAGITVGPIGSVELTTDGIPDGTLTLAMPVIAPGSTVDIEASASLIINGKIQTTGTLQSGADDVSLSSDIGDITVSKAIVTNDTFSVGAIDLDAPVGNITIAANLESKGGLEADGADITMSAGGDIVLQGDIGVNASGADTSSGGQIDIEASGNLTVGSSVELISDGSQDPGSDAGSITLIAGIEGVAEDLPGNLTLQGDIKANGHAAGGGNNVEISGCTVSIPTGAIIDITGDPSSSTVITARKMLSIGGQVKSAGPNVIQFATGTPPSLTGTIVPAASAGTCTNGTPTGSGCSRPACTAVNVPLGCLNPCPQCGNNVTEFPETCDIGAGGPFCNGGSGGDFCDAQCRSHDCDDGNPCTNDSCDPTNGCVHASKPNGTGCADNNVCNGVEACSNGQCVAMPGTVPSCPPDTNPCTNDGCDPQSGCFHTAVPDGQASGCTDTNLCNGTEQCVGGTCQAGTLVTCPPGMSCNPSTGACISKPCQTPADCNDNNPCTDDLCPGGFCSNPAKTNGTSCDDNNVCNGSPTCQSGVCTPVLPLDCNDNNACTTDTCNPVTGCQHGVAAGCCNVAGDCNDADACTTDTCNVSTHTCQHGATPCDDGMPCTADACDPQSGCTHTAIPNCQTCSDASTCPDDADPCTDKVCLDGRCQYPLSTICCTDNTDCLDPDGNPCTGPAACDTGTHRCGASPPLSGPQPGCGTTCIPGTCVSGTCTPGTPLDCNDNNLCTSDVCVDGTGCTHPTIDLCCTSPAQCVDQNVCTVDGCDVDANRCTHEQPDVTCTPCTGTDPFECGPRCQFACMAGRCQDAVADCNDNNPCTADACDASAGCTHTPQDGGGVAGCDDGQACNGAEQCVAGVCQHAAMPDCDDDDLCTDDSCLDASGCTHTQKAGFDAIGCRIDSMSGVLTDAGAAIPTKTKTKLQKKVSGFAKKLATARDPAAKCKKAKKQLTALARQLRGFQKSINRMIGKRLDPAVGTPLADLAGKAAKASDDQRAQLGC